MHKKTHRLMILAGLVLMLVPLPVLAAGGLRYYFMETSDDSRRIGEYVVTIQPEGDFNLEFTNLHEHQLIDCTSGYGTRSWRCEWLDGQGAATAELVAGHIIIKGRIKGRVVEAAQDIGTVPWLQAPDYQLSPLIAQPVGSTKQFWVINSQDFVPYQMLATNHGTQKISVNGQERTATLLMVSIYGLPEFFWHNDYWYDPASGQYLRFEGRRGAPWTPRFTMEFLRKE